ncbi:MAG: lipid A export permease/ATP-binding protein MsbA [Pseudomonadota bacterium]
MNRPATTKELYLRLLRYVIPYWKIFVLAIASIVVVALTEPAIPALMKPLLDGSFIHKDPVTIRLMPVLLILLFLVRGIANYSSTVALNWVSGKVIHDMRAQLFARLLSLPSRFYDNNPTGTLISKITFNVNQVAAAASDALLILVRDTLSVIGLLALMAWINWKLSVIFFVVAPAIGIVVKLVSGRLRRLSTHLQQSMGEMTGVIEEAVKGQRVVKLFGGQHYESSRFGTLSNRVRHMNLKIIATSAANVPAVQLIAVIALAVMIYIASSQAHTEEFTVGSFISFFGAMGLLFAPLKRLTKVNEQLQRGLAASQSIFDLLEEPPEPETGSRRLAHARGELVLRHVSLRYDSGDVAALEDINLEIAAGETIALVGKSGSGKTSLAALVPRFYQPTAGQILLDGVDLQEVQLADLRTAIALVNQDIVLFNDTIAANIAYGSMRGATRAAIEAAAEAAHAMEFIRTLPQGMDTLIGENGARLSGGQRQRLAIARALLKDAPILILDEATSALDTESERHVQVALRTLMQGRTSIIIAHRLSTIEHADRIVVLEQGRIVECGTHGELLDGGGAYWRLYNSQLSQN